MEKDNYILSYYQKIKDGTEIVGQWIELLYEIIIKGLEEGSFFYDKKKANKQIDFIENHCHHIEGKKAPDLLKLELWQKAFISLIFGIVDKEGLSQFREVMLVVARKNGKSLMASSIIACKLFNCGEYGANAFCVAPKLDQANIVYNAFLRSSQLDAELNRKIKSRKSDIYIAENNATCKKIPFKARTSDGYNPSVIVADEVSMWSGEQGLKQYEVMKSAMGAREEPLLLTVTTAGYVNDGIYDDLMKRATRFLKGNSTEQRFLPVIYQIDDINKWDDITELHKSNPNLSVSVKVDYMLEEIAVAEQSLSRKNEFLCKYCNVKTNSSTAWLNYSDVEKACGEPLKIEEFEDCYCVMGVDLSRTVDLSCTLAMIEKGGEFYIFAQFYMPANKLQEATERDGVPYEQFVKRGFLTLSGENMIDYHDCYNWIRDMVTEKSIYPLYLGYDRYSAGYLIAELKKNIKCDDVWQGDNLWGVIQEFESLLKSGKIHIGDNDLLKSHMLNSAIEMKHDRGRGKLTKVQNYTHVDGMASILDAMAVRSKFYGEIGEQLKNEG